MVTGRVVADELQVIRKNLLIARNNAVSELDFHQPGSPKNAYLHLQSGAQEACISLHKLIESIQAELAREDAYNDRLDAETAPDLIALAGG